MCHKNNNTVTNVIDDIQYTNDIRAWREVAGITNRANNPYCWWKAALVMLSYKKQGTITQLFTDLEARTSLNYKTVSCSHFLRAAADGVKPDKARREYTQTLPYIVEQLKLSYVSTKSNGHSGRGSRNKAHLFYFKNSTKARNVLLTSFPDLIHLFAVLDASNRRNPIVPR